MKYAVVTFGCRVNQADSYVIEAQLRASGLRESSVDEADVVIVNTCSVTASADQGARQVIRRISRNNPAVRVIATGCYATRRPEELRALPNVAHVVPNGDKLSMVDMLGEDLGITTVERFSDGEGACGQVLTPGAAGRTALTLRVQTGCEEQCAYCIIPQTRGGGQSRPLDGVVRDIQRAVGAGYKEVAITGVHLGSYGRDLRHDTSLTTLVRRLSRWDADVLFRLSSLEPMDCTDEIIGLVGSSERLAPHFHLPLQHGADGMLRAMRRPYSVRYYWDLTARIRRDIPDAAIGSDIIVGFPGETERDFDDMRAVLDELPLTHLHVFPYSDRPGTAASRMQPKVDGGAIRERAGEVRAMGARKAMAFRRSQEGIHRRALTVDDGRSCVTDNYLKVQLAEPHPRNEWVRVCV